VKESSYVALSFCAPLCVCVSACACVSVCVCVHATRLYLYLCIYKSINLSIYLCVSRHIYTYIYLSICYQSVINASIYRSIDRSIKYMKYKYTHTYSTHTHMCVCVCVCIMCTIYTNIHACMHAYTQKYMFEYTGTAAGERPLKTASRIMSCHAHINIYLYIHTQALRHRTRALYTY